MKNEATDRYFDATRAMQLAYLKAVGVSLIEMSAREGASALSDDETDWLKIQAQRLAELARELCGEAPEEPQAGEKTECMVITGGYGTSIAGRIRNIPASEPEGPQLVIPLDMNWTQALAQLDYITAELSAAIHARADSKVGALNLEDLPF